MSVEEKQAFQRIGTIQETPTHVHFEEEEVPVPISNDVIDIVEVSPPIPERNPSIFRYFLNAINRALHMFY